MKTIIFKIAFVLFFLSFALHSFSQEIKWLKLYNFKGEFGVSYESLEDSTTQDSELIYDYNENFLKYILGLDFSGYVYHPYFVEFTLDSSLILNKADTRTFADTQAYSDLNNRYDLNIWVLKRKPLNFYLYFRNNETTYPRVYLGRYFNYFQQNGVKVTSKYKYLPFTLDISHSSTISQSLYFYDRRESSNDIKFESVLIDSFFNSLTFKTDYKNYTESVYGSKYISLNSTLNWIKTFEEKKNGRINGNLSYIKLGGTTSYKSYSGNLHYFKPVTKDLDFFVSGNYSDTNSNGITRKLSVAETGLRHRLYLSLRSSATFSFQDEKGDLYSVKRDISSFSVNYTKKIPTGRVGIRFFQSYQNITNSSKGGYSLSEFYASFDAGDTITVNQTGIDPQSITVMSKDGTIVYTEGVDYNLVVSDTMVVIVRLFGGRIEQGETVLIVYNVAQYPDYKLFIHNYEDSASLTLLKYLFVKAKIRKSRNTIDSDFIITPYEQYTFRERGYGFKSDYVYYQKTKAKYYGNFSEYVLKTENFRIGGRLGRVSFGYYFLKNNLDFYSTDYFSYFRNDAIYLTGVLWGRITYQFDYRRLKYNQNSFVRDRKSIVCKINGTIRKLRVELFYEYILDKGALSDRKHDYFRVSIRRIF